MVEYEIKEFIQMSNGEGTEHSTPSLHFDKTHTKL